MSTSIQRTTAGTGGSTPRTGGPKIVIIGAGSAVFGQRAISAILRSEVLKGTELPGFPAQVFCQQLFELAGRAFEADKRVDLSPSVQRPGFVNSF